MSTSLTAAPFDSQSVGESVWNAFAKWFVGAGVRRHELNELETFADSSGMQFKTKTGRIWGYAQYGELSTQTTVAVAAAHATLNRIDRAVIRVDWSANSMVLDVLTGTAGASPAAPSLTRSGTVWEFSLAQIAVDAAVTTIAAGKVTDERSNADVCGYSYSANPCQNCTSALRPSSFEVGGLIYQTDNNKVFVNVGTYTVPSWTELTTASSSFAAPALTFTTANAAGAASTAVRTDASLAIFDATSPSTQAIGDAAVVGTAAFAARRDHKHAMPSFSTTVSTQAYSDAAAPGVATDISRGDHKHAMPAASSAQNETGTAVTISASVTETTLFSYTVPANTLSTNKRLRLTLICSSLEATGTNHNGTLRYKWGGATQVSVTTSMSDDATRPNLWYIIMEVANKAVTNSQIVTCALEVHPPTSANAMNGSTQLQRGQETAAIDTTANQVIAVSMQLDTNSASFTFTMHHALLELV